MRILIASPLFPPDVDASARYAKELATRLATDHQASLLIYSRLPETIRGVPMHVVPKNWPTFIKFPVFTLWLFWLAWRQDLIIIQNGISTELPALIVSFIFGTKMIVEQSDQKVQHQGWRAAVESRLARQAKQRVTTMPLPRPEVSPFTPLSAEATRSYEQSWQTHLTSLLSNAS